MAYLEVLHLNEIVAQINLPLVAVSEGCVVLIDRKTVIELPGAGAGERDGYCVQIVASLDETDADLDQPTQITTDPADDSTEFESQDASVAVEIHPRVAGYEVRDFVGRGGMGTVWRALQLSTKRFVALKTINPTILGSSDARKRFQREVELAARLTHPNIARVYESGLAQGSYFYSMDLIEGLPWHRYIKKHRPSRTEIFKQLLQVLEAIAVAHEQGIVHRDLKPSNILIDQAGTPYVVDFGLAKLNVEGDGETTISKDGVVMGTLAFMSPEQASGRVDLLDQRSDVYSLGVILVYLLNSCEPKADDSEAAQGLLQSIFQGELSQLVTNAFRDDVQLQQIVGKALSPTPDRRYSSARDFATRLKDHLDSDLPATELISGLGQQGEKKTRSAGAIAALVCLLLFVGGIAGYQFWPEPKSDPNQNPEAESTTASPDGGGPPPPLPPIAYSIEEELLPLDVDGTTHRTDVHGGLRAGKNMDELPDPRLLLIGFELQEGEWKTYGLVKSARPIWLDPTTGKLAESQTKTLGTASTATIHRVVAKDGFAVSSIEIVGGRRVHALKVTFMRIKRGRLDPDDSYEREWIGDMIDGGIVEETKSTRRRLGNVADGDCDFVVGIHGYWETDVNKLGLILVRSDDETKSD